MTTQHTERTDSKATAHAAIQATPQKPGNPSDGLQVGRIVHFVQADGQCRPAIVVNLFDGFHKEPHHAQLVVFHDGTNDAHAVLLAGVETDSPHFPRLLLTEWATSVPYSAKIEPHTYHWFGSQANATH
jgi:hypothetical protein